MAEQKVNFQQDRGEKAEKTDYRIVVLGDDNYITWKWHMTMVLKAKGLFACVESDLVLEPDKAVQATTLLASALSELNMQRVINCNSAFYRVGQNYQVRRCSGGRREKWFAYS